MTDRDILNIQSSSKSHLYMGGEEDCVSEQGANEKDDGDGDCEQDDWCNNNMMA